MTPLRLSAGAFSRGVGRGSRVRFGGGCSILQAGATGGASKRQRDATGVTEVRFDKIFVFAFIALNSLDEVSTITAAKELTRSLVKYTFINRNQETFTVTRICDMMDVFPECLL